MELGNGFPNALHEWIIIILLTGLVFAVYRRVFNMLLCGFGLTRARRIRKAESYIRRYSDALGNAEELSERLPIANDADKQLYLSMLQGNLEWAIDCSARERNRRIWDNLGVWTPPHPTLAESLSSQSAQVVARLNRQSRQED